MPRLTISAQNQFTDWIDISQHNQLHTFQVLFEGDRSNGSTVTVQAQRTNAAAATSVDIATIANTAVGWALYTVKAPIKVRAGVATGGFGTGDDFVIDIG